MKKVLFILMCLSTMLFLGVDLKAQEITITLMPEWNWISYPNSVTMEIDEALGDFVPMEGDRIKSQFAISIYVRGDWRGGVTQFVPGCGYKYYSSRTENVELVFARVPSSFVTTTEPTNITSTSAVVGGTVTIPESSHVFLRGVCWGTEPNPDIDDNHTSDGTSIGSFNDTLAGLAPGTTYYVRSYAVTDYGLAYGEELSFTTTDHEYVDLGLPSGTLWATCNVGADSPEEYGDYFAWGETQPKDIYNWSTYQYCNGSLNTLTKYCNNSSYGYGGFTDDLTTLLLEEDAAMANWGTDWRMPTQAEWQELYQNTTSTWMTKNGVSGRQFTAMNGNSLFVPAAGDLWGSELSGVGYSGNYWSSSLNLENPASAWGFYFNSDNYIENNRGRCSGLSVRAVRSAPQTNAPTGAINGKFTINGEGDQVYFSQGNLQYIGSASTPYWKFAENQWECLGTSTGQNSTAQNVDRDLFGWGTSGWDCGNTYYFPWNTSGSTGSAYGPLGSFNLTGIYANADWGVYNPISNGGNQPNQWRTLSTDELGYVFDTRMTESGIRYAKANVNEVNGVILLPDDWSTSYYSLNDTNTNETSYSSNTITASEWGTLEQHGAVFLPATGYRFGASVHNVGSHGYYWSSSYVNGNYAYGVYFLDSNLISQDCSNRAYGRGVRLVQDVE
jgi:uncharacterized protein (TIGR02145 family)